MKPKAKDMAYSDFHFVEIAKYVPKIGSVIRVKQDDEAVMLSRTKLDTFRAKHNNSGVYSSVFRYMKPYLDAPRCSPLYFDMDSDDLSHSHKQTRDLYHYLLAVVPEESISIYFTGSKGFHVEVSGKVLGVGPSMDLAGTYRLIAEDIHAELDIDTLDFAVYEPRRMWRLPNSQHQKTGLFKVRLLREELFSPLESITELAVAPRDIDIEEPGFSPVANEWLKSKLTKMDERKEQAQVEAAQRRLDMFNKYGTAILGGPSKAYVRSVWQSALKALQDTEPGKNRNTVFSRQAFRLYITALDANMDIENVTSRLQEIGIDMGLEDREVQATLKSALSGAQKKTQEEVYV